MTPVSPPVPTPVPTPTPASSGGRRAGAKILVDPERLRYLATKLTSVAGEIEPISTWSASAIDRIELEANACLLAKSDAVQAARLGQQLKEQAQTLANNLMTKAHAFEQADAEGVSGVNTLRTQWVTTEQRTNTRFAQWLDTTIAADRDDLMGRGNSNQCVSWAAQRRHSLGGGNLEAIGYYQFPNDPDPLGARHLAEIYRDSGISGSGLQRLMEHGGKSLNELVKPGTLIIWGATRSNPDGHVAVVEYVTPNGLWISEFKSALEQRPTHPFGTDSCWRLGRDFYSATRCEGGIPRQALTAQERPLLWPSR